jgi:hypothetical protein
MLVRWRFCFFFVFTFFFLFFFFLLRRLLNIKQHAIIKTPILNTLYLSSFVFAKMLWIETSVFCVNTTCSDENPCIEHTVSIKHRLFF